jgi:2-hydroxy-6-oxonona-2,4-dienedioate hydrolase
MKRPLRWVGMGLFLLAVAASWIAWRFNRDIESARARVAQGAVLVDTPCGKIEYQDTDVGVPLLAVHGSGGGHDQGMALAGGLARQGVRVIAMSRFGYLRTPMPADASAAAQAQAHVCLLDALGIPSAAVMGYSAGGPSALQMAVRHPDRVSALILTVPIAYKPPTQADSAPPMPAWFDSLVTRVSGSDFLAWAALHMAPNQAIKFVLATPPELVMKASTQEQARVNGMLHNILPVSARVRGLQSDTVVGKHLGPSPLASVRAPTLIFSARDDRYGTYASAQYTASQISGTRFIGFDEGGHALVGHYDQVMAEVGALVTQAGKP